MPTHASTDPTARMGVYTRLEDVPESSRLHTYAAQYEDRDVWQAYIDSRPDTFDSAHYRNTLSKAGSAWKNHMSTRGRHHALARPTDVESWLADLSEMRTLGTVYSEYWVRLEEFYRDSRRVPRGWTPRTKPTRGFSFTGLGNESLPRTAYLNPRRV
jgi:hypothetical protein